MQQPPIQDYAIIGDGRSAALISRLGSIDWLCWPRFDSPACFSSLLDPEKGGRFSIRPTGRSLVDRRYLPGTNVLETSFHLPDGEVSLVDFMPVASEEEKAGELLPDHDLVRLLVCEEGTAEIEVEFAPAPGFGLDPRPLKASAGPMGIRTRAGRGMLIFRSDAGDALRVEGRAARGKLVLREGEAVVFSLSYSQEGPAVLFPLPSYRDALERTVAWWRSWSSKMKYEGPYREQVLRSALALKLLIYAPSGAVIAAPTTSLPEEPGKEKNWDYRFCWLRDASFMLRALFGLGFRDEAEAFMSWLLHSTRLTHPRLRVLYNVYGETSGKETNLPLRGYRGARPVRVGNLAETQLQLDVYGEVLDAAAQFIYQGGTFDRETARMLTGFGDYVCQNWRLPDEGIWEVRTGRRHHTHSRVLCWAAMDRLVELCVKGFMHPAAPTSKYWSVRQEIRQDVETHGWNEDKQSYISVYGTPHVDSVLLLFPWYGFEDASSPRMRSTYARVQEELSAGDGLLYRYRTMGGDREGAFGVCSFWAAEYLARGGGSVEDARRLFTRLLRYANDVGLYAEEIDPDGGAALGNFPQGFTHVGVINAAIAIEERIVGQRKLPHHVLPRRERR